MVSILSGPLSARSSSSDSEVCLRYRLACMLSEVRLLKCVLVCFGVFEQVARRYALKLGHPVPMLYKALMSLMNLMKLRKLLIDENCSIPG